MKKIMVKSLLLGGIIFISSCNSGENTSDTEGTGDSLTTGTDTSMVTGSGSSNTSTTNTMADDSTFVMKAADGGMLEVQLGKIALTKATASEVKHHAKMMVDDHSKANSELKTLAASKNITLPTSLSAEKQQKLDEFKEKKKGADFDKAYTDFMIEDHKKDIDAFRTEANNGADTALKSWAAGKVPTLESHLQMWESAKNTGSGNADTTKNQ